MASREALVGVAGCAVGMGVACQLAYPTGDFQASPGSADALSLEAGDVGDAGDAGVAAYCDTRRDHFLCADFDESAFTAGWSGTSMAQGGNLVRDLDAYSSPPASAKSAVTYDGGGASAARFQRTLPVGSSVDLSFAFYVDGASEGMEILALQEQDGAQGFTRAWMTVKNGQIAVGVRGLDASGTPTAMETFPVGETPSSWARFKITLPLRAGGHLVVAVGGHEVVDNAIAAPPPDARTTALTLELGAWLSTPGSSVVHYDDVLVDPSP